MFSLLHFHSEAQNPLFRNLSIEDGLPSNEIYSIYLDESGYLWFGGDRGIARFNGRTFNRYSTNDGLGGNVIYDFYKCRSGGFFAFSLNRQVTLIRGDSFTPLKNHTVFDTIPNATQLYRDFVYLDDELHARCYPGTYKFTTDSIIPLKVRSNTLSDRRLQRFFELDDRIISIIGTDSSFEFFDFAAQKVIVDSATKSHVFRGGRAVQVGVDSMLIAALGKLMLFNNDQIKLLPFSVDTRIEVLYCDSRKNYWMGALGDGLFRSDDLVHWERVIKDINVSDIQEDQFGGIWVSTLKKGVYYNPLPTVEIEYQGMYNRFSIGGNQLAIAQRSGVRIVSLSAKEEPIFVPFEKSIFGLNYSEAAGLWLIGGQHLFGTMDSLGRSNVDRSTLIGPKFYSTHEGKTVAASAYELTLWNSLTLTDPPTALRAFPKWFAICQFAPDGTLWASSSSNTYRISLKAEVVLDTLPIRMSKLIELDDHRMFVSTYNDGLWLYDGSNHDALVLNRLNGFVSERIYDLNKWKGDVALLHDQGLSIANMNGDELKLFHYPALGHLLFDLEQLEVTDDRLYFGNGSCIISCSIEDLEQRDTIKMHMQVSFEDEHRQKFTEGFTDLSYNQNSMRVQFDYVWYQDVHGLPIRYKLHENAEWRTIEGDGIAHDLNPGSYTLHAQFKTPQGNWKNVQRSIQITINPPWWQIWWVMLLIAVCFIVLVIITVRVVTSKNLRKKNELERLQLNVREMQLKALKAQLNPHFIFNSINSLQYFIAQSRGEEAEEYVRRFSRLIRTVLENSEKKLVSLKSELDLIAVMVKLESMKLKSDPIHLEVEAGDIDTNSLLVPPFLFQPYIENAIWHGLRGMKTDPRLRLHIASFDDFLNVVIEDNGVGRDQAKKRNPKGKAQKSFGMLIASRRIKALNQEFNHKREAVIEDMFDEEQNPAGTRVIIQIPKIISTDEGTHS